MENTKENSKWTLKTAVAWLEDSGCEVGVKVVSLTSASGLTALGCSDYLHNKHGYSVVYPSYERKEK